MAKKKKVEIKLVSASPTKTKTMHLFRADREKEKKDEGWEKVDINKIKDKRGKILGVRIHADDLILMEK